MKRNGRMGTALDARVKIYEVAGRTAIRPDGGHKPDVKTKKA